MMSAPSSWISMRSTILTPRRNPWRLRLPVFRYYMPSSVQDLMISAELTPMGVVPWLSPELPSHAGINILSLTPNAAEIEPNLTPPRLATEREQVQDIASTTIARLLPLDLNRAHGTVGISLFHEVTKLPLY